MNMKYNAGELAARMIVAQASFDPKDESTPWFLTWFRDGDRPLRVQMIFGYAGAVLVRAGPALEHAALRAQWLGIAPPDSHTLSVALLGYGTRDYLQLAELAAERVEPSFWNRLLILDEWCHVMDRLTSEGEEN